MRLIPRTAAVLGATAFAFSLLPTTTALAEEVAQKPTDRIVRETTVGSTNELTYEDGSTFSSTMLMSGQFDWTAEFDMGIFSREYSTPNSGTHTVQVNSISNCNNSYDTPYIRLEQKTWYGWSDQGTKEFSCGGGTLRWSGMESDTYRWFLGIDGTSSGSDYGRYTSGTTYYP